MSYSNIKLNFIRTLLDLFCWLAEDRILKKDRDQTILTKTVHDTMRFLGEFVQMYTALCYIIV